MKAIVLLSGGIDSTVILSMAIRQGRECIAISFDYGQKHIVELQSAAKVAAYYNIPHKIIKIDPSIFGKSSLTSMNPVPKDRTVDEISIGKVPSTYVPARNTLFLAYALGQAEIHDAHEIYVGPNAQDKAYADCHPDFFAAFQKVALLATCQGVNGHSPRILTPLIHLNKQQIIEMGLSLKAPLELTLSCYDPPQSGVHCNRCDACTLREWGFLQCAKDFLSAKEPILGVSSERKLEG